MDRKPPVETWAMMKAAKDALGATEMQKIFSVGQTQINRYCRNPNFTSDSERNPIDRMRLMLRQMVEQGAEDEARAIVALLCEEIGARPERCQPAEPDRTTLAEECLDDYPAVTLAHQLMRDGEHPRITHAAIEKAKDELEQTQVMYERRAAERQKGF